MAMTLPPYLHVDLPPENVYGHRHKVECLRASIDRLRTSERPNLRVLDAGCGSGRAVTRFLARQGDHVLGIDMHAPSIEYAQRHYGEESLRFICSDLSMLPDGDGEYDAIVLADVLEHLTQPEQVLAAAVARLAPGGMVLVSVPNGRGPFEIESAISRLPVIGGLLLKATDVFVALLNKTVLRGLWSRLSDQTPPELPYNEESGHVQFFSTRGLEKTLRLGGLKVHRWRNVAWWCGPFTNYLFAPSEGFCRINTEVANRLPRWFVSVWYVECTVRSPDGPV
ncbi:class I SAM-dependent methyltransferase [Hydrogenophaga sp. XSHU_21]